MRARLPDGSVIISGFLAKDAEYKQVGGNNSSLTKFSVKVGERQPKVQGERGEAVWVNCQCWHSVARATKALKKFDVVLCMGKVEKKPYTSKDGDVLEGTTVTMAMAKAEGWTSNSKWRNMPEQMLAYRAASFFARVHCPETLMGVQVEGEVEDSSKPAMREVEDVL